MSKALEVPIHNPGQSGCDDCAYACLDQAWNKYRPESGASAGEALPGDTGSIQERETVSCMLRTASRQTAQKKTAS